MKTRAFWIVYPVLLTCGPLLSAAELKSGPQVIEQIPGSFFVLNVINVERPSTAGTKSDPIEQYGARPVIMIFAREPAAHLLTLLKKLDNEVTRNKAAQLAAVVIFLSDDEELDKTLRPAVARQNVKHVSLAVDSFAGPPKYKVASDADVTIILYRRQKVEANHAFTKGELNEKRIEVVVTDLAKIVGK